MKMIVFFTRGISLDLWLRKGLFDREKLIYEEHLLKGHFNKIYWITYGSRDEILANKLKEEKRLNELIKVLPMPKIFNIPKIGTMIYSFLIPFFYINIFKNITILKTNQMNGSIPAILVKLIYNKPLILRTGYTRSIFLKKQNKNFITKFFTYLLEQMAYKIANVAIVASENDKNYICSRYRIDKNKINVLYNFIDTNKFKNLEQKRNNKFIFVGRLSEQKNLFNIIDAISKTNFELDIYGSGELKNQIDLFIKTKKANVHLKGEIANCELPFILNKYKYYILASFYEGMPKTLLEAMACGCICVGTDVEGINEVIKDKVNGLTIKDVNAESIYDTLKNLERSSINIENISLNAESIIQEKFSLKKIVSQEYNLILGSL